MDELECRVCRCGEEDGRPLYTPCLCSGSIGLVHQDCLEAWLKHSKKDTCELCFAKYEFVPQYAQDAPAVVPPLILLKSALKLSVVKFLPIILKAILALLVWLVFVPVGSATIYCLCIGRDNMFSGFLKDFRFDISAVDLYALIGMIPAYISQGIVIDSVIALALLTLLMFSDFIRFHWMPDLEAHVEVDAEGPQRPNDVDAPQHEEPAAAPNLPHGAWEQEQERVPVVMREEAKAEDGIGTGGDVAGMATETDRSFLASSEKTETMGKYAEVSGGLAGAGGVKGTAAACTDSQQQEQPEQEQQKIVVDEDVLYLSYLKENTTPTAVTPPHRVVANMGTASSLGSQSESEGSELQHKLVVGGAFPEAEEEQEKQEERRSCDSAELAAAFPIVDSVDHQPAYRRGVAAATAAAGATAGCGKMQQVIGGDENSSGPISESDSGIDWCTPQHGLPQWGQPRPHAAQRREDPQQGAEGAASPDLNDFPISDSTAINLALSNDEEEEEEEEESGSKSYDKVEDINNNFGNYNDDDKDDNDDGHDDDDHNPAVNMHRKGDDVPPELPSSWFEDGSSAADYSIIHPIGTKDTKDGASMVSPAKSSSSSSSSHGARAGAGAAWGDEAVTHAGKPVGRELDPQLEEEQPRNMLLEQGQESTTTEQAGTAAHQRAEAGFGVAIGAEADREAGAEAEVGVEAEEAALPDWNLGAPDPAAPPAAAPRPARAGGVRRNAARRIPRNLRNPRNPRNPWDPGAAGNPAEQVPPDVEDLGPDEAVVELRVLLLATLGFEEPVLHMLRNAVIVLGFCALFMVSMAALPYAIGGLMSQALVALVAFNSTHRFSNALLLTSVLTILIMYPIYRVRFASRPHVFHPVIAAYALFILVMFILNRTATAEIWQQLFHLPCKLLNSASSYSNVPELPLRYSDFYYIGLGFCTLFAVVFICDKVCTVLIRIPPLRPFISNTAILIKRLALVCKVGVLLLMRILMLPMVLGIASLVLLSHTLLPFTLEQWAQFLAQKCVAAYALAWAVGITFMLTMTVSVLQLREVLHPAVLGALVRPQEPHSDLVNSLVSESGVVHVKRMVMSLVVYLLLLAVLVWAPLWQLHCAMQWTQALRLYLPTALDHLSSAACSSTLLFACPATAIECISWCCSAFLSTVVWVVSNLVSAMNPLSRLHLWYVVPEVQIPVELFVGHIAFLALLDTHKDVIGRLQHLWLVWVTKHFGCIRFLLPMQQRPPPQAGRGSGRNGSATTPAPPSSSPAATTTTTAADVTANSVPTPAEAAATPPGAPTSTTATAPAPAPAGRAENLEEVGPPLPRPPTEWDSLPSLESTRWSWGTTEEPSQVERSLAPRSTPSYWLLRTAAVVLCSWQLLNLFTYTVLMVPLSLGRLIFSAAPGLSFFTHDPLCLVVGVIVMLRCIGVVAKMALLGSRSEWVAKLSRIPLRLYWRGLKLLFVTFLSLAVLGVLVSLGLEPVVHMMYILAKQGCNSICALVRASAAAAAVTGPTAAVSRFELLSQLTSLFGVMGASSAKNSGGLGTSLGAAVNQAISSSRGALDMMVESQRTAGAIAIVHAIKNIPAIATAAADIAPAEVSALVKQNVLMERILPYSSYLKDDIWALLHSTKLVTLLCTFALRGAVTLAVVATLATATPVGPTILRLLKIHPHLSAWLENVTRFLLGSKLPMPLDGRPLDAEELAIAFGRIVLLSDSRIEKALLRIQRHLVAPLYTYCGIECLFELIVPTLMITCMKMSLSFSAIRTADYVWYTIIAAITVTMVNILRLLGRPVLEALRSFYNTIKDDNYLLGRRLVNANRAG